MRACFSDRDPDGLHPPPPVPRGVQEEWRTRGRGPHRRGALLTVEVAEVCRAQLRSLPLFLSCTSALDALHSFPPPPLLPPPFVWLTHRRSTTGSRHSVNFASAAPPRHRVAPLLRRYLSVLHSPGSQHAAHLAALHRTANRRRRCRCTWCCRSGITTGSGDDGRRRRLCESCAAGLRWCGPTRAVDESAVAVGVCVPPHAAGPHYRSRQRRRV